MEITKNIIGFVGTAGFFVGAYKGITDQLPLPEVIILMFISTLLLSIWARGREEPRVRYFVI